jgi:hypothetical protein
VALNTLSNGVAQRDVGQMVETWMLALQTYGPWLKRMGRKLARIAGRCQSDQALAARLQLGRIPQADGGGQFDQMVAAIDISQSAYAVFFR